MIGEHCCGGQSIDGGGPDPLGPKLEHNNQATDGSLVLSVLSLCAERNEQIGLSHPYNARGEGEARLANRRHGYWEHGEKDHQLGGGPLTGGGGDRGESSHGACCGN